jgi:hypothetical protein
MHDLHHSDVITYALTRMAKRVFTGDFARARKAHCAERLRRTTWTSQGKQEHRGQSGRQDICKGRGPEDNTEAQTERGRPQAYRRRDEKALGR